MAIPEEFDANLEAKKESWNKYVTSKGEFDEDLSDICMRSHGKYFEVVIALGRQFVVWNEWMNTIYSNIFVLYLPHQYHDRSNFEPKLL